MAATENGNAQSNQVNLVPVNELQTRILFSLGRIMRRP